MLNYLSEHIRRYISMDISFRKKRRSERALLIVSIVLVLYAFTISLLRYLSLGANMYDLGMFDQALWHMSRGHGLYSPLLNKSVLAHHWMPILFLLAPPYYLGIGGPSWLLLVQSMCIGLVMWMCGKIMLATTQGDYPVVCFIFAMIFFLSTGTQNALMYDFHPDVFSPLLSLALFWFSIHKRRIAVGLSVLVCLLVKEHMGLVIAGVGLLTISHGKQWRAIGSAVFVVGMLGFFAITQIGKQVGFGHDFMGRYSWLGGNVYTIIRTLILEPVRVLNHVFFAFGAFSYFGRLLFPVAGLALLSPRWLLPALPAIAINTLADYELGRDFRYHYQLEIMPWLYLAAFHGLLNMLKLQVAREYRTRLAIGLVLAVSLCTGFDAVRYGRLLPFSEQFKKNRIRRDNLWVSRQLNSWISQHVDPTDKVAATGSLLMPALTHRNVYKMIPEQEQDVPWDFYIFDLARMHWDPIKIKLTRELQERIRENPDYELVHVVNERINIYMLKSRSPNTELLQLRGNKM